MDMNQVDLRGETTSPFQRLNQVGGVQRGGFMLRVGGLFWSHGGERHESGSVPVEVWHRVVEQCRELTVSGYEVEIRGHLRARVHRAADRSLTSDVTVYADQVKIIRAPIQPPPVKDDNTGTERIPMTLDTPRLRAAIAALKAAAKNGTLPEFNLPGMATRPITAPRPPVIRSPPLAPSAANVSATSGLPPSLAPRSPMPVLPRLPNQPTQPVVAVAVPTEQPVNRFRVADTPRRQHDRMLAELAARGQRTAR
jgi:hypothetical protein